MISASQRPLSFNDQSQSHEKVIVPSGLVVGFRVHVQEGSVQLPTHMRPPRGPSTGSPHELKHQKLPAANTELPVANAKHNEIAENRKAAFDPDLRFDCITNSP